MSTKIYNAYKLNKKLTLNELMNLIDIWRTNINEIAEKEFARETLRLLTYYLDMVTFHGPNWIIKKTESLKNKDKYTRQLEQMYNELSKYGTDEFHVCSLLMYMTDLVRTANEQTESIYASNLLKSEICIYPIKNKILFMYFGNSNYQQYIEQQDNVLDYHYQNQCDRPEGISKQSYERRRANWDIAIGPDYIPINHGFSVQFINPDDMKYSILNKYLKAKNMTDDLYPDIDKRVQSILNTCDDYPNPPAPNSPYSVWRKYQETEEYLAWKTKKIEDIKQVLSPNLRTKYFSSINNNE